MRIRHLMLVLAWLVFVGSEPVSAMAGTEGQITSAVPLGNGTVLVSASATILAGDCENEAAWWAELEGSEPPPCGGRLALVVSLPTVERRGRSLLPAPRTCPANLQWGELRNTERPGAWLWGVREWGGEAYNPPSTIAWRSAALRNPGPQPAINVRLHLRYRLWPGGMLEAPCLYLAYIYKASGATPVEGCLPEFKEGIREELCDEEYWQDTWAWTLSKRKLGTAYPSCRAAERAYRKALADWRRGRHIHAMWRARKRMARLCPPPR